MSTDKSIPLQFLHHSSLSWCISSFYISFKLIHFQLWTKESHQSPNFETFKCSGENLPYSSCHFPNHKSVFLQILHHSSVSWKITPLYFLGQTLNTLHNRNQWKCKFVRLLSARIKIHQILVIFETTNQFFFKFCINLQCHETQLLCTFLAEILYTFNKRSLSKYKFDKIESLKFDTLMDCFRQNNMKFQLKKYRWVISHDTTEWYEV